MKKFMNCLLATAFLATAVGLVSCDNDDEESTKNAAEIVVDSQKSHDTAILLCTFGSTYKESMHVYDETLKEFKAAFPDADVYLSFTSHTCIGRVEATTGEARYQADSWLKAFGKAGYKKVAVQSLHVIPGEEYLSLMNTTVKKDFMISGYPKIEVLKSANLLASDEDTEEVAEVLYNHYKDILKQKTNIVLLMGHGNPDVNYNANQKYADTEKELQEKAVTYKNVFVGTVDYGDMLFWPNEENAEGEEVPVLPANRVEDQPAYKDCIYNKLRAYCKTNNLKPEDITIHMAPFMSIAGDHAHNDLWGLEDGNDTKGIEPYSDASWRLRLQAMGFKIDQEETHPSSQLDADHGIKDGCKVKALGDYPEIRAIWLNHLKENYNKANAWENGEKYQPEA